MAIPDTNPLGFPVTWPFLIQKPLGFPITRPILMQTLWVFLLHIHCIRFYSHNIASLLIIGNKSLFWSCMHVCTYYLPWPHTRLSKCCMWHSLTFSDTTCKVFGCEWIVVRVWITGIVCREFLPWEVEHCWTDKCILSVLYTFYAFMCFHKKKHLLLRYFYLFISIPLSIQQLHHQLTTSFHYVQHISE